MKELYVIVVSLLGLCTCTTPAIEGNLTEYKDGDILIGYLDSGYTVVSKKVTSSKIENMLSFIGAVSNTTLWPQNCTVGYVVYLYEPETLTLGGIMALLNTYPKIVALVGIRSSEPAVAAATFATSIRLPIFTYSRGLLLDDVLSYPNSEYLTRITSYATVQMTQTIPDILRELGVNFASIIYGKKSDREFRELAKVLDLGDYKVDIDFAERFEGADSLSSALKQSLLHNQNTTRLNTFVIVASSKERMAFMDYLLTQQPPPQNLLLILDSRSCVLRFLNHKYSQLRSRNVSVIRLCQTYYEEKAVLDYYDSYSPYSFDKSGNLKIENQLSYSWYLDKCRMPGITPTSTCNKTFSEYLDKDNYSRYNHRLHYTVLKVLAGLQNVTAQQVQFVKSRNFTQVLRPPTDYMGKLIYDEFRENLVPIPAGMNSLRYYNGTFINDYEVLFEGTDDVSKSMIWEQGNKGTFNVSMAAVKRELTTSSGLRLECSVPCGPGFKLVHDTEFISCWTCEQCRGNTYTMDGAATTCSTCNKTLKLWANPNHTRCDTPPTSVDISTVTGKVAVAMATVNICVLLFTVGVYVWYWKNRVIISSGRDLATLMFIGILIGHIEAILIVTTPSFPLCNVIQTLAHLFMILTVVPLLVRTFRIWFVFKYSIQLGKGIQQYINTKVIAAECAVLAIPQLALLAVGFCAGEEYRFDLKTVEERLNPEIVVTMSCGPRDFTIVLVSIGYTSALLLISSALGWGCRKLPNNFKESMHIFISSLVSLLLVASYVPAMVQLAGFAQIFSVAMIVTVISLVLNVLIFFPKLYAVLCLSPLQQKKLFQSTRRTKSSASTRTVRESVSGSYDEREVGNGTAREKEAPEDATAV